MPMALGSLDAVANIAGIAARYEALKLARLLRAAQPDGRIPFRAHGGDDNSDAEDDDAEEWGYIQERDRNSDEGEDEAEENEGGEEK